MNYQLDELSTLKRDWVEDATATFPTLTLPHVWSTDDLHGLLPVPREPNWQGVLIAALKRRGLIERVGYQPSKRLSRNGAIIALWKRTQTQGNQ